MKHPSIQIIHDEHLALAAMLQSMRLMVERGPGSKPAQFFEVLRAMLFYIDEFPEQLHHTKETELLFPPVATASPEAAAAVERLNRDHAAGERTVRELQHLLLAWEMLGDTRKTAFVDRCGEYLRFYQEHMRLEETVIIPQAERCLSPEQWRTLDGAFARNCDPLTGKYSPDASYEKLFQRIVNLAPAPIGLGEA